MADAPRSFADRLNHLFATVVPAGRGPYSNEEVAAALRDAGVDISRSYISLLRKGERDNPTLRHIRGLAEFFGVPLDYFGDDEVARRVDAELSLLAAMRDAGVRSVALRALGLSPRGLDRVADIIDHVRDLEGLPPNEP